MFEEINTLVNNALCKDESAILTLIDSLQPMILNRIQRIHPYTRSKEDLISSCNLLLLQCLDSFNPDKKVPFVHYFHMQLQYYLWDQIKKEKRAELCVLDESTEDGLCLVDSLESDENIEDYLEKQEDAQEIQELLDKLPQRESQIIQLYYFTQLGLSEISAFLDLSYQTVANTKSRALKKLRSLYDH